MAQKSKSKAKSQKSKKAPSKGASKRINADIKREQKTSASSKFDKGNVIPMPGFNMTSLELPSFEMPGFKSFKSFNLCGMEQFMPKQNFEFEKYAQDAATAGRESMEAFIKFQTTFTKGFEDIMRTAASLTQSAAEKQAEYTKQMMGAKTLNELTAAQNKIAKSSFDEFMAGATKLSEMSVKVLNESCAPLNDQMAKGMQKAGKMAA